MKHCLFLALVGLGALAGAPATAFKYNCEIHPSILGKVVVNPQ